MTPNHDIDDFSNANRDNEKVFVSKDGESKIDTSKTAYEVDVQDGELQLRPASTEHSEDGFGDKNANAPVDTAEDLVTKVIHLEDDPNEASLTFRTFFLGSGLSIFASVLQEIFYFKPQTIFVSLVFLTVIAYVLGDAMAAAIPRKGVLRYLNPHEFTRKEHAAITIMASSAAMSALATEALSAQELFYGGYPSKAAGIFIVLSSQLLGFGVAGLLRDVIVHPVKMLWPMVRITCVQSFCLHVLTTSRRYQSLLCSRPSTATRQRPSARCACGMQSSSASSSGRCSLSTSLLS